MQTLILYQQSMPCNFVSIQFVLAHITYPIAILISDRWIYMDVWEVYLKCWAQESYSKKYKLHCRQAAALRINWNVICKFIYTFNFPPRHQSQTVDLSTYNVYTGVIQYSASILTSILFKSPLAPFPAKLFFKVWKRWQALSTRKK